jgi:2-C-methyl-D-erythritol 4-phosphate cytidylyltransferase/2-C-methyl-D-erythritol 2,4-cyclodiphosphate synthase
VSRPASARRVWAVVPAAGHGRRFDSPAAGSAPKQYALMLGASVLEWSLRALLKEPRVHGIVVVLASDDVLWPEVAARLNNPRVQTAIGGENRQNSVMNGLLALQRQAAPDDWVLVHDAARPCLSSDDLRALLDAVGSSAAVGAVLAAPIVDTVKRESGAGVETVERQGLWRALTPQIFGFERLRHALDDASRAGIAVTDEAQAIERQGLRPALVSGSGFNIKVTRAEDLKVAERILQTTEQRKMRIGQGFDVHAFGLGEHVMLGGVRIAHSKGVVAHSDGDVVIHALCDAVLGALGEGDIGKLFPDTDPKFRGMDSRLFLREVAARMRAAGMALVNADITVLAEAPRISKHRDSMAANLAADLGVAANLINIKATTTERLGFIGRGEGLAALASVLLG